MKMLNISILLIIFLFHLSIEQITNIIVLPFKTYKEPFNKSNPISSIVNNHIYTEIEISNQTLVATFKSNEYGFYMTNENCIEKSNYIIQKSESFTNLTNFDSSKEGFASERMLLYRDIDLKIKQLGYYPKLRITSYGNERQCAIFGLKMRSDINEFIQSFLKTFKENTNIKDYQWTLKYNSNEEGLLILGDSIIECDPQFKQKKYYEHKANVITYKSFINFGIKFDDVMINNISLNVNKEVQFFHELGVILVDQKYYDQIADIFFTKYINDEICIKNWVYEKYGYIRCDGKKFTQSKIKSFPKLYFKQKTMNYIFELNYKDLFTKKEDGWVYFLVVFDLTHDGIKFGKPFLKKYTFTVDNDKNTISFYELEKEVKKSNLLVISLFIILIIFIIVISLWLIYGYKLLNKKTKVKKRANELEDNYEYMSQEKNENNKKIELPLVNNLGI